MVVYLCEYLFEKILIAKVRLESSVASEGSSFTYYSTYVLLLEEYILQSDSMMRAAFSLIDWVTANEATMGANNNQLTQLKLNLCKFIFYISLKKKKTEITNFPKNILLEIIPCLTKSQVITRGG